MSSPDKRHHHDTANNTKRKHWFPSGGGGYANKRMSADLYYTGIKGVLVTCNMREVECLRETYNLLNEYNDKLGIIENEDKDTADVSEEIGKKEEEANADIEELDIERQLQNEIAQLKSPAVKRFRQIPTKCKNIIFVQILNSLDPMLFVEQIFSEIKIKKSAKGRFVNRITPVQRTCKATIESVESIIADILGEKSDEESSFMVVCKIRNNNELKRMDFVDSSAAMVKKLRPKWKVEFGDPKITLTIDIMIKVCCVAFLPDYLKLRKYNLIEYASACKKEDESEMPGVVGGDVVAQVKKEEDEVKAELGEK